MGGTVFLFYWLLGLRLTSSGVFRLLGGAGSWCWNRDLWQNACWLIFGGPVCHLCSCPHSEWQLTSTSPADPSRPLVRFSPGSYGGVFALCWFPTHVRCCVLWEVVFCRRDLCNPPTHSLLFTGAICPWDVPCVEDMAHSCSRLTAAGGLAGVADCQSSRYWALSLADASGSRFGKFSAIIPLYILSVPLDFLLLEIP